MVMISVALANRASALKFWAAFIGTIFIILDELVPAFPLEAEQVTNIVYVLVAYIIGVAIDDGKQIFKG